MQKSNGTKPIKVQPEHNVAQILRGLIEILCEEHDWSLSRFADEIEQARSGLHRFVETAEVDARVALLSRMCARFDQTPLELLARHPALGTPTSLDTRRLQAARRLAKNLSPGEAVEIADLVIEARELGCFGALMDAMHTTVGAVRDSNPKGKS